MAGIGLTILRVFVPPRCKTGLQHGTLAAGTAVSMLEPSKERITTRTMTPTLTRLAARAAFTLALPLCALATDAAGQELVSPPDTTSIIGGGPVASCEWPSVRAMPTTAMCCAVCGL